VISSSPALFRIAFPIGWFGIVGLNLVSMFATGAYRRAPELIAILVVLMVVGIVLTTRLWKFADEVRNDGDALLVTKGGIQERIPLAAIVEVKVASALSRRQVTLRLAQPGRLGGVISFIPFRPTVNPYAGNPIVEDLIARVDAARHKDEQRH